MRGGCAPGSRRTGRWHKALAVALLLLVTPWATAPGTAVVGDLHIDPHVEHGPQPATGGGEVLQVFVEESRDGEVTDVSGPTGTLDLHSPAPVVTRYASGTTGLYWGTNGFVGNVYTVGVNGADAYAQLRIELPPRTRAFSFYLRGNFSVDDLFVAVTGDHHAQRARSSATADLDVDGSSGAQNVVVYATGTEYLRSVAISNYHASLAVGQFAIASAAEPLRLLALGDSYSSGEGAPDPETGYTGGACHRSVQGWPTQVDESMPGISLVANLACSGAEIEALHSSFQGQLPQLDELMDHGPVDVVTLTLGGNDIGFAKLLERCVWRNCAGRLREVRAGLDGPGGLREQLRDAYAAVRDALAAAGLDGAEPVVVGYPAIFPDERSEQRRCAWLWPGELDELRLMSVRLDDLMRGAARSRGLHYVSTLDALDGHEECSKDPWMYPLKAEGGQQRGHPTMRGQAALAEVVERVLAR